MNIEFIEWMVGKCPANQFRIYKKESKNTYGLMYVPEDDEDMYQSEFYKDGTGFKYGKTVYHILLGKTIEGINREIDFEIIQHEGYIDILKGNHYETFFHHNEPEAIIKAKESSMKYIYEQETK